MDPNANIAEQIILSQRIIMLCELTRDMTDSEFEELDAAGKRLAELVLALDGWRKAGRFDPYSFALLPVGQG